MKLARLEIVGFKSFAEKVTLHFSDGITSVVGPNGCGKSNIVDAIRWVMGEQSAKYLRGRAMEDVIFAGSDSRGPMGLAEVTLTLKNDGRMPPDYAHYDEIAIRRRLFRDGTSEYAINKVPVRLKDVHDVFLGTGVGTRAYSMIEQGRIGFIVNSKPEERRFLIEEVAGITKYKARKKTAQRRMEATEQNLLRVNDIITELSRQLGSLERQAQKAERYKRLKGELKDLELWTATQRFFELRNAERFFRMRSDELGTQEVDLSTSLAVLDTRLEATRAELADVEADNARKREQVYALDSRYKMLERDLEFFAKERDGLKDRGAEAAQEAETLKQQRITVESEIRVLEDHVAMLGDETERVLGDLNMKETKQKELTQQRKSLAADADRLQREMIEALTKVTKDKTELSNLDHRRIELDARIGRVDAERAELANQIAAQKTAAEDLKHSLVVLGTTDIELKGRLATLDEQVKKNKQGVTFADAKVLALKEQAGELRSRLQSLTDIDKKYEGYGDGVRAIMTREDRAAHGIFGLVADIVAAKDKRHEAALEAVLGERLQFVVVESQKRGLEAVEYLRSEADGRGSFIPLDIKQDADKKASLSKHVGYMPALVTCDPSYRAVVDYLLGDVVLVDDLDAAVAYANSAPAAATCVTLTGEVLETAGVITGGANAGVSEGLLTQKREIKELGEQVREMENQILLAENERAEIRASLISNEQWLKASQSEWHELQIKQTKCEKDLAAVEEQARRLGQRGAQIDDERAELERSNALVDTQAEACKQRMTESQTVHSAKEQALFDLDERDATLREEETYAQDELTALKVQFAQKDEKQKNVLRTLERLNQTLVDNEERIQRAHNAVQSGSTRAQELTLKIESAQQERVQVLDLHDKSKQSLIETQVTYEKLAEESRLLEDQSRTTSRDAGKVRDERMSTEMKAREQNMQLDHLVNMLWDQYQVDLRIDLCDFHMRGLPPDNTAERVSALKAQLSKMGDINLTAIEEYDEVKKRFDFLSSQKSDLETALTQLRSAILKINRTSRERFLEAFNATNTMFQKVFPRLFRGGEARLELIKNPDTDDVLESGIDIVAQPPGKKLQSVQLLSGGEKALTAVSLVFSIFLIKPSPFCVLDEVDAPLDENNVLRFNELLREISQFSQFIVITHNKRTMECAHRLYGVTMDEPGISKLVSVNLQREETIPALS
jgi:chromosome segregation protein